MRANFARLDPRLVVLALAIWATGTTIADGTTAGFGADSYGYVSQAELWLEGHLKQAEPWAEQAPWPQAAWTFAPLGYRPPVGDESRGELIPTYSPGLPMAMALVKRMAGHCAMFGIVPVMAGLLVWATFGLGRRLGSPGAGVLAAWLVATSPAVILAALRPMTDVPVAAIWTMAFVVALGRGWWSSSGAGLLAGIAILIRPNLVLLAAVLGLWFVIRRSDGRQGARSPDSSTLPPSPPASRQASSRPASFSIRYTVRRSSPDTAASTSSSPGRM